jgi:ribosome recycling factor
VINEIRKDAADRMQKTLHTLEVALAKIRTGRAHPSLLTGIMVSYYGNDTPLEQVANIVVEDGRTLLISPWEKAIIPDVEKAILKSDLGLTPSTGGESIRLPMPPLTEENRVALTKVARQEAEHSRVAIRNIRRDANAHLKELLKDKEVSEDEEHHAIDLIQKLTDERIADVEHALQVKEKDLMEI